MKAKRQLMFGVALVATASFGCGGLSDEEQALQAANTFDHAMETADGEAACGVITERYREIFAGNHGSTCEAGFEFTFGLVDDFEVPDVREVKVATDGMTAEVSVEPGEPGLDLVKEEGEWRVPEPSDYGEPLSLPDDPRNCVNASSGLPERCSRPGTVDRAVFGESHLGE
jgi:hypothetical protein